MKPTIEYIGINYPRVGKALETFWGFKEFRPYVDQLLSDSRGTRQGFPAPVVVLLMNLLEEHDKEFPEFVQEPEGWASTFY